MCLCLPVPLIKHVSVDSSYARAMSFLLYALLTCRKCVHFPPAEKRRGLCSICYVASLFLQTPHSLFVYLSRIVDANVTLQAKKHRGHDVLDYTHVIPMSFLLYALLSVS